MQTSTGINLWSKIIYPFINLWGSSFCFNIERKNKWLKIKKNQVIIAFWHKHFFIANFLFRGWKICALVSPSRDGELEAYLLQKLGFKCVRVSSAKFNPNALLKLRKYIKDKYHIAIVLDGSRGPIYDIKPGIVWLSYRFNLPMLFIYFHPTIHFTLNTWDKTVLPLPFSTIKVNWNILSPFNKFEKNTGKSIIKSLMERLEEQ